ncbi:hypothetical protein PRIPAC_91444 [Pristionchus pacificus]|uniref:Uncharacterized protein n=1 Tax=Pristionchus pacificus TaxID=54126 RepID=A0A2A6CZ55_PRIPA|nr:hypothetical protein PRIPAC_91444 [Pristionchus pacificus]|eukprot:PDM83504.1 hypothetical protein PRIPAC_35136 [Pristionchus pacificus]
MQYQLSPSDYATLASRNHILPKEQRSSLPDQSTPSTKHKENEMSSIHLCVKEQEGDKITEDISTHREKEKKIVNEGSTDDDRSLEICSDHSVHKCSFQSHSISMNRSLIANVGNGKKQGEDEDLGGREQTERLDHMFSTEILDASTVTLEGNTPFPKWTSNILKMERLEEARKESATAQQDLLSQEAFSSPLLTVTTVIAENLCTTSMIVEWGVHYRNLGDYVSYRDLSRKGTLTTLEISERSESSSIQSLDKVISDWGQIKSGLG